MTTKRLLIVVLTAVAMLAVAAPAHAYVDEVPDDKLSDILQLRDAFADPENPTDPEKAAIPCEACHGTAAATEPEPPKPHGNYSTTTSKCATCHAVHNAPADSILLLPAATVLATCETCHDGTGGTGVYGVIVARGQFVNSDHNMLNTETSILGGDPSTGGARSATFSGVGGGLTCSDCHSPHGSNVVNEFTGDRARSDDSLPDDPDTTAVVSSRLLRQRPTSMETTWTSVADYGSDWCGACHAGRLSKHPDGEMKNHPVDSVDSTPTPFIYENVAYWDAGVTPNPGTLGRTNRGYVMPDKPRNDAQLGHAPICQQCHEDARNVGNNYPGQIDPANEEFSITGVDGTVEGDNPRFQVFPHESNNLSLLLEEEDNLCTNCHPEQGS